jgi:NADPH2:quinone reductase
VFTLRLLTGEGRARRGAILAHASALAKAGELEPLLNERRYLMADLEAAFSAVESGSLGKVVVAL